MDLNKLGLVIGILALMLAVPLAVLANLLTPTIRDWYSTTSLNRLRRRITELDYKLGASLLQWTFTAAEWETYGQGHRRAQSTSVGLSGLFSLISTAFAIADEINRAHGSPFKLRLSPWPSKAFIEYFLFVSVLAAVFHAYTYLAESRTYLRNYYMHTDQGRQEIKADIERLKDLRGKYEYPE